MKVSWLKRDVLLFAHSIGCKFDELQFLYELHSNFQVVPTYPVILSFKDNTQEVIDFYSSEILEKDSLSFPPNAPKLDSTLVVDGARSLKILKPLPTSSEGRDFEMKKTCLGVYDKGDAGSVLHTLHELVEVLGEGRTEVYARVEVWSFYIGQGNWGGPRGPRMDAFGPPERKADVVIEHQMTNETPLLYRLNGDYNPLHATPQPGVTMGFRGVILHGLIAWNISAHAILREICASDGRNLREFTARFASPVKPGDKLIVEIWKQGKIGVDGGEGWKEVRFRTSVEGGKVALSDGRAVVKPGKREEVSKTAMSVL